MKPTTLTSTKIFCIAESHFLRIVWVCDKLRTAVTIMTHFLIAVSPVVIKTTPHLVSTTPYKRFTVTCTARAVIEGQTIPLEMTLNWRRRRLSDNVRFTRVPSTEYVTTGSSENGYQSVLNTYELDTENRISYRCRATPVSDSRLQGTIDTVVNVYAAGEVIPCVLCSCMFTAHFI